MQKRMPPITRSKRNDKMTEEKNYYWMRESDTEQQDEHQKKKERRHEIQRANVKESFTVKY